jgi:hypothetical protein
MVRSLPDCDRVYNAAVLGRDRVIGACTVVPKYMSS